MGLDHAAEPSNSYLTVFNIQRMSTEDGPGLRTTVFAKGCNLECRWCHNPEGIPPSPQVVWHGPKCIGARACDAACPEEAILRLGDEIEIDRRYLPDEAGPVPEIREIIAAWPFCGSGQSRSAYGPNSGTSMPWRPASLLACGMFSGRYRKNGRPLFRSTNSKASSANRSWA